MTELKLEIDNCIFFENDGSIEHLIFLESGDMPVLRENLKIEQMVLDFIAVRQIKGSIPKVHHKEVEALMNAFEDGLALLKAAIRD